MEYRRPLDEAQLRQALLYLRNLKAYLRLIGTSFAPRDATERRLFRHARQCVQEFAASARARDIKLMNRWARQADAEILNYWNYRRVE
jgi:hypothetical protein